MARLIKASHCRMYVPTARIMRILGQVISFRSLTDRGSDLLGPRRLLGNCLTHWWSETLIVITWSVGGFLRLTPTVCDHCRGGDDFRKISLIDRSRYSGLCGLRSGARPHSPALWFCGEQRIVAGVGGAGDRRQWLPATISGASS